MNPLLFLFLALVIKTHRAASTNDVYSNPIASIDVGSIDKINDTITVPPYPLTSPDSFQRDKQQNPKDNESSETSSANRFEDPSTRNDEYSSSDDDSEESPDLSIPYSEHENPKDVSTRPKYVAPGEWVKPPKDRNIHLDFVPRKLYAQVRGKHTVKRLPREEAIKEAKSDEERENAPRLREVVTDSKVNTVYTEEGYEDSAYDHAGHIRDADYHEGFARKLHEQVDAKQKSVDDKTNVDDVDSEDDGYERVDVKQFGDYDDDYRDHYEDVADSQRLSEKDYPAEYEIHPKLVTENGLERLQEDLKREDLEAERRLEITKVQEDAAANEQDDHGSKASELTAPYQNHEYDDENNQSPRVKTKKRRPVSQNATKRDKNFIRTKKRINVSEARRTEDTPTEVYELTVTPNDEEILSTGVALRETTLNAHVSDAPLTNPLELSSSALSENSSPHFSPTTTDAFSSTTEDGLATISYGQVFWDFFKSRQQATTIPNLTDEETTTTLPIANGRKPYHVVANEENGLSLTNGKSQALRSRNSYSGPISAQGGFSANNQHDKYQTSTESEKKSYVPNKNSLITKTSVLDYDNSASFPVEKSENSGWKPSSSPVNELSGRSAEISATSSLVVSNDRGEEVNVDYASNPLAGAAPDNAYVTARRKPRYKVLVRPKPRKTLESTKRDSADPIAAAHVRNGSPRRAESNENYLKMLSYIKKDVGRTQDAHTTRSRGSEFIPTHKKKDAKNPPRVHPPVARLVGEVTYPNFLSEHRSQPGATIESELRQRANWKKPSTLPQEIRASSYPDPFTIIEPQNLGYPRVPVPATGLLPPTASMGSDYARYRAYGEGGDYLVHLDAIPRESFAETLGYAPLGFQAIGGRQIRAGERRRRAARRGKNDEIVKAAARNGTSNRGESERARGRRAAKIGRNSSGTIMPVVTARFGPDTSSPSAKQAIRKKSRLRGMTGGRGELSLEPLHKINDAISGGESGVNLSTREKKASVGSNDGTFEDGGERGVDLKENIYGSSRRAKRSATENKSISNSSPRLQPGKRGKKTHEDLLDETPRVTSDVIEKELSARFKKNETGNESAGEYEREKKVEIEVPEFDYVDELTEEDHSIVATTTEAALDLKKYPFYMDNRIPSTSALKYIVDPGIIPKKTVGGTEFYESRDAYKQCDEIEPNLAEVVPKREQPLPQEGPNEDSQRLGGLGEKLDCYKAKYFDENPFDNPLFSEHQVEEPPPPKELNSKQFSSRIMFFPKANDEYIVQRPSRKPEFKDQHRQKQNPANSAKTYNAEDSIHVNYRHDPRTINGRNAYFHSLRASPAWNPKDSRRQKQNGNKKRPVSTVTEPSTLYPTAPYQNQVYEDVMGNIRHMANSYKVYEPDAEQSPVQVSNSPTSNVKLSISNTPTNFYFSNADVPAIDITESPSNVNVLSVEGLVPPQYVTKRPVGFRRNRVPQRNRARQEKQLPSYRIIGHYQKLQIHKRSVVNWELPVKRKNALVANSTRSNQSTLKESADNKENAKRKTEYLVQAPDLGVAESALVIRRRKSNNSKNSSNVEEEPKNEESQRVVYTIRDRIRHSKPKVETKRIGKFVANETTLDEDRRRKEPRYNVLKRKKGQDTSESSATTTLPSSTNKIAPIDLNTDIPVTETSYKGIESESQDNPAKTQQTQHSTSNTITETSNVTGEPENDSKLSVSPSEKLDKEPGVSTGERPATGYAVYEKVDENIKTTTSTPLTSTIVPDFDRLKAYLQSNPPGYVEAFPEETTNSSLKNAASTTNDSSASKDHDSKEDNKKNEKDHDGFKQFHRSYFSNEESTERINEDVRTPSTSKSEEASREASGENSNSTEDTSSPFLFSSRPSSPAESFEDHRYSDLGTRVSKPAFYHPPFSVPSYEGIRRASSKDYSASGSKEYEGNDSDTRKDYMFPWYRKEEDEAEKRGAGLRIRPLDRFEFPWERRERMARGRKRQEREKYERLKDILGEENDDVVATKDHKRQVYPWDRYDDLKGHTDGKRYVWRAKDSEGEESSNEHRPTMKFSSRYSSKSTKLPIGDKSRQGIATRDVTVEEVSEEEEKVLEEDSGDKSASAEVEVDSSHAKKSSSTERTRGISRGMIIPEDVTLAPRRKNERKKNTKPVDSDIKRSKTNSTSENLEKSESKISSVSAKSNRIGINANSPNSTKHTNGKRRRKVSKTPTTTVETSTKSNVEGAARSRRKQRIPGSYVASTSPASVLTTSTSRLLRRKPQKQINEVRWNKVLANDGKGLTTESTENSSPRNERNFRSSNKVPWREKEQKFPTQYPPTRSSKGRRNQVEKKKTNNQVGLTDETDENTSEKYEEEKKKETQENLEQTSSSPLISEENLDSEVKNHKSFDFEDRSAQTPDEFGMVDTSVDDDEDDANFRSALKPETHLPSNLLQSVSQLPGKGIQRINTSKNERKRLNAGAYDGTEEESAEAGGEEDDEENKNRDELRARFIKDPEQRLYYYVER